MSSAWGSAVRATALVTIAACGGSTSSQQPGAVPPDTSPDAAGTPDVDAGTTPAGSDAASGGGSPIPQSDSGTGSMVNCGPNSPTPASIAGTWDVQGSRMNNTPLQATVLIDDSHFTFAVTGGSSLTFSSAGNTISLVWLAEPNDAPVNIVTTRANAPLAQGILPLPLGGLWTFTGSEPSSPTHCQAQIATPTLTAGCVGTSGFPEPFPNSLNGSITGTRMQTLPSLFGDLGGTWHVTDGGSGSCDASFHGNAVSALCTNAGRFTGEATLTFCDGVASGSTSGGVEFSALRQ